MTVDLLLSNQLIDYYGIDKNIIPHIKDVKNPDHWCGLWRATILSPDAEDDYSPLNFVTAILFTNEATRYSHLIGNESSDTEELLEDFTHMLSSPLEYQEYTTSELPTIEIRLLRGPHPSLTAFMGRFSRTVDEYLQDGLTCFIEIQSMLNRKPCKSLSNQSPLSVLKNLVKNQPPYFMTTDKDGDKSSNIINFPENP